MPALQVIDASTVRRWARRGCEALGEAAAEIDELNVFPVPDGDTGTNLYLTLQSAVDALDRSDQEAALVPTLDRLARGALLGARGNSGVIVSQLLRGIADRLGKDGPADGPALAAALTHASDLAYAAVAEPVEGTILTVARDAAAAASAVADASGAVRLEDVARAAAHGAASALERTPAQLAALARAGVVDAGGRGLCVLLDALLAAVTGSEIPIEPAEPPPWVTSAPSPLEVARGGGPEDCGYEVQFLLEDSDEQSVEVLRSELAALGNSLVVVGSEATSEAAAVWNVHVHVDDVGAAIEAGIRAGRPHSITVIRFEDQLLRARPGSVELAGAGRPTGPWSGRGLVAVAPGAGLAGLFAGQGVEVVEGGPTRQPSTSDVLTAIRRTGAAEVVVLPNHTSLTAIADAAAAQARAGGQDVAVVPTKSAVQGLAAIAVADPTRRFADVVIALAEAAAATRWAEITVAAREAMTSAGRCAAGDVLGLAEGDVVLIGNDQVKVTCELLDRLLSAGGELVTLILGTDAVDGFIDEVRAHLRRTRPGVDVMDYRGDQPHLPVLIGVE
ncbi:MAG: DAK2 domain-containing protein [Actinomycetota bacterium]|nr:DAK2 domain-containing protein [Actinomycetota bacterium]